MDRESVVEKLRNIPLFCGLSADDLKALLTYMTARSYRKGTTVVSEGERGLSMYVLLSGEVKVATRDREGNELFLAILDEGQFFGEMALLSGRPRNATVTTTRDSVLLEFRKEGLVRAIRRRPEMRETLNRQYRERMRATARVFRSSGIIERRQRARLKEALDVRLRLNLSQGGRMVSKIIRGLTTDVTDRGLCVDVEGNPLSGFSSTLAGAPVAIELFFGKPSRVLRLVGTVRWCAEVGKSMQFRLKVGVAFGEMGVQERVFLGRYAYGEIGEEEPRTLGPAVHEIKI